MRADARTSFRVGVVVTGALAVLTGAIWTLGQQTNLFSSKLSFVTHFRDVAGLSEGSDVRLAGYRIGHIDAITLPGDMSSPLVELTLSIESRSAGWIRSDTRARLKTLGLLGDKYIDLSQGSPAFPELAPGSEIEADQPVNLDALLDSGENMAENLLVFSKSLRVIGGRIERGEGLVGEILQGSDRTSGLLDELSETLKGLRRVVAAVEQGDSPVGLLIGSGPRSQQATRDLSSMLENLAVLSEKLNHGDGLVGRLVSDPKLAEEVIGNISQATADMRAFTARLEASEGLVGRLIADEAFAEAFLGDLQRTASSLDRVVGRLAEGEGTLGKLLVDETLYQGINDILAGSQRSTMTRWILTSSQKEGADERLRLERENAPERAP